MFANKVFNEIFQILQKLCKKMPPWTKSWTKNIEKFKKIQELWNCYHFFKCFCALQISHRVYSVLDFRNALWEGLHLLNIFSVWSILFVKAFYGCANFLFIRPSQAISEYYTTEDLTKLHSIEISLLFQYQTDSLDSHLAQDYLHLQRYSWKAYSYKKNCWSTIYFSKNIQN